MRKLWAAICRAATFTGRTRAELQSIEVEEDLGVMHVITHNLYNPIEDHLRDGDETLGNEIIRLAKKHNYPMTFDLLHETPQDARQDLIRGITRQLLSVKPKVGNN
jgi:hypothetical protein